MSVTFDSHLADGVATALDQLGEALKLDLSLDPSGGCYFEHDDGWRIGLMLAGEDQLVAAVTLASAASVEAEALAQVLTDFNWLGGALRGATLSYNPRSSSFVVWRSMDAEATTAAKINRELIRLIETAAAAKPILLSALEAGAVQGEHGAGPRPGMLV